MKNIIHVIPFALFFLTLSLQQAECQTTERFEISKAAQDYITAFRRDEYFTRPVKGLVFNRQIIKSQLDELGYELEFGMPQVREKLVRLLLEVGFQANSEPNDYVLRNQTVIKLLSTGGLSKGDLGLGVAANVLRNHCTPNDLATYGEHFTKALNYSNDSDLLLLVAKAKPQSAQNALDKILLSLNGKRDVSLDIALAALGNTTIEDRFIALAKDAKDGKSLASALKWLGYIGTHRSLSEVATYLRTPLKVTREHSYERTVRMDALEALSYNFPGQRVLFDIRKPEDYAAAEAFCTEKLGVFFDGPLPDFPPDRVFPVPLPR